MGENTTEVEAKTPGVEEPFVAEKRSDAEDRIALALATAESGDTELLPTQSGVKGPSFDRGTPDEADDDDDAYELGPNDYDDVGPALVVELI